MSLCATSSSGSESKSPVPALLLSMRSERERRAASELLLVVQSSSAALTGVAAPCELQDTDRPRAAHHVRALAEGGNADGDGVPLCRAHHAAAHL